jgi:hypothetical protein
MRAANVILVVVSIAGLGAAAWMSWRWRRLPLVPRPSTPDESAGEALRSGLRTFNAVVIGAWASGVLVVGLGGRLFMRIMGALSPDAQGLPTEAEETVGRITFGGSYGFVLVGALFFTLFVVFVYLVGRPWLPASAAAAGLVLGVIALGTIGVSDPMDPKNPDFDILEPAWLAVVMLAVIAVLAGLTWTAVAARVEAGLPDLRWGASVFAYLPLLISLIIPWVLVPGVVYIAGRVVVRGRVGPALRSRTSRLAGGVVIGILTVIEAAVTLNAAREIVTA